MLTLARLANFWRCKFSLRLSLRRRRTLTQGFLALKGGHEFLALLSLAITCASKPVLVVGPSKCGSRSTAFWISRRLQSLTE